MGKKSKSKSKSKEAHKTPEQEAKRALVNILNYDLPVFSLIVDLDLNVESMSTCLDLIHEKAPKCSVLLISESEAQTKPSGNVGDDEAPRPLIGVAALSTNPNLEVQTWITAVCNAMDGTERGLATFSEAEMTPEVLVQLLHPKVGVSPLKEKDKGLAASHIWLKSEGLGIESESDSGENFMASFEFED